MNLIIVFLLSAQIKEMGRNSISILLWALVSEKFGEMNGYLEEENV